MDAQSETKKSDPRLSLHRIFTKNSSFESFGLNLSLLQNPVQTSLEMQIFSNNYPQENHLYQVLLSLKIEAKNQADLLWRIQLEQAGYYTLEGFTEEQQNNLLNGYCLNQLYSHAGPVVNQLVVQAGLQPVYLQPMDFYALYQRDQEQKKAQAAVTKDSIDLQTTGANADLSQAFKKLDAAFSMETPSSIN